MSDNVITRKQAKAALNRHLRFVAEGGRYSWSDKEDIDLVLRFAAQSLAAPDPRPVLTEEEREAVESWLFWHRSSEAQHGGFVASIALASRDLEPVLRSLLARSGPCPWCAENDAEIARRDELLDKARLTLRLWIGLSDKPNDIAAFEALLEILGGKGMDPNAIADAILGGKEGA